MTPNEIEKRIVRDGDLIPCKTAFIDAHTPGSDQKENFTIIGGGVSESADQHVHLRETPALASPLDRSKQYFSLIASAKEFTSESIGSEALVTLRVPSPTYFALSAFAISAIE